MTTVLVAVDTGTRDTAGAEHLVHVLDDVLPSAAAGYVASTHVVRDGEAHTAVAASFSVAAHGRDEPWSDLLADVLPGAGVVVRRDGEEVRSGPAGLCTGAASAADAHHDRTEGRLARFRGRLDVEAVLTAGEVVARSDVDEVVGLMGTEVIDATVLDLRAWARPTWREGRAVLVVQRARGGVVPFESPVQRACCTDH